MADVKHRWPLLAGQQSFDSCGLHLQWWHGTPAFYPPQWNARKDRVLLRHGELFGDDDGDPLKRYEAQGAAFVEGLNGRFAGVLIDLRDRTAMVFNDRYGLGPCVWHQDEQGLYFASSARALRARLKDPPPLDDTSLAETVSMGCVLEQRTLFRGIERLPPAALWMRQGWDGLRRGRYFSASDWTHQPALPESVFQRRMCKLLARRIPVYAQGDDPVGMSLTGGLDGRLVMAWSAAPPNTLPCYSFSGPLRECHDASLARRVAQACGQPHKTLTLDSAWMSNFPRWVDQAVVASDGLMDASGAVEIYINQLARAVAPVRLTGNWGSEILRGHVAFRPRALNLQALQPEIARGVKDAQKRYQEARQGDPLGFIAFKQVPWHHSVRLSLEESQLKLRSPFLDNEIVALMHRAPDGVRQQATQASLRWVRQAMPALADIPTDRGLRWGGSTLMQSLRQWQQTFWIKAEYAMDYGMPSSWAPRLRALGSFHPERWTLGRHKFYHFRSWYQGPLATVLKEVLLDPTALSRSVFQRQALEKMVMEHTAGRANHTLDLHRAWSLEAVHQHLLGRPSDHMTETLP